MASRRRPCIWFGSAALQGEGATGCTDARGEEGGWVAVSRGPLLTLRDGAMGVNAPFRPGAAGVEEQFCGSEAALNRRLVERGIPFLRGAARRSEAAHVRR